ncbi:MAG: hypothetical protein UV26_C0011G0047 [candidate division WWE3 bacterium GW2011_GWF2_42_42]|uniref:Uncharacterized protein n=1 Tax=candidate division WWE3 bacterium GW2011_GWF2_42_42 TaxID=1619142 RepID=A0A0G1AG14_UNCKA|nr:MAG: hypothetical protein UV26_C0011G0047 [candidate division WWE3 bacterium GW2011_GWF2_42_42]
MDLVDSVVAAEQVANKCKGNRPAIPHTVPETVNFAGFFERSVLQRISGTTGGEHKGQANEQDEKSKHFVFHDILLIWDVSG